LAPRDNNRLKSEVGLKGSDFDAALGMRVRVRRTLLRMSQADLAAQLSFSQQQMALIERGEGRLFASHLHILARVLGVPVDFFFGLGEPLPVAGSPAFAGSHESKPTPLPDTNLDMDRDRHSNREVQLWIKAFLRIPAGRSRSRLLTFITNLASQPNSNLQLKLLGNSDK
jgi:transcriptional regulator with XRE-family HTH domain